MKFFRRDVEGVPHDVVGGGEAIASRLELLDLLTQQFPAPGKIVEHPLPEFLGLGNHLTALVARCFKNLGSFIFGALEHLRGLRTDLVGGLVRLGGPNLEKRLGFVSHLLGVIARLAQQSRHSFFGLRADLRRRRLRRIENPDGFLTQQFGEV
jgi:hypothetical protein